MSKIFLDANVLYSNAIRSLFIWLNTNEAAKIYWSMDTWEEVFVAYARHHNEVEANKFRASMTGVIAAYSESLVQAGRPVVPFGLRDPNDEHVLAAAIECGAGYIVTADETLLLENLESHDLEVIHPDRFLTELVKTSPLAVIQSMRDHISSLRNSRPSIARYIESLRRAGLVAFADWLVARQADDSLFPEVW